MEKSDSKTSVKHGSEDEKEETPQRREEEQPTTSQRANTCSSPAPVKIAHNMNDLKCLDFNSADEIRQAMKAILANCKIPPPGFTEEAMNFEPKTQLKPSQKPVTIPEAIQNQPANEGNHTQDCSGDNKNENLNNPAPPAKKARSTIQPWRFRPLGPQDLKPKRSNAQPWILKPISFFRRNTKRGRPPKAGPSKRVKKSTATSTSMYVGKLSNVVPFRRGSQAGRKSDSDSDGMCH